MVPKTVRTCTKLLVSSAICLSQDQHTTNMHPEFGQGITKNELSSDFSAESFFRFVCEELDLRVDLFVPEGAICIAECQSDGD